MIREVFHDTHVVGDLLQTIQINKWLSFSARPVITRRCSIAGIEQVQRIVLTGMCEIGSTCLEKVLITQEELFVSFIEPGIEVQEDDLCLWIPGIWLGQ